MAPLAAPFYPLYFYKCIVVLIWSLTVVFFQPMQPTRITFCDGKIWFRQPWYVHTRHLKLWEISSGFKGEWHVGWRTLVVPAKIHTYWKWMTISSLKITQYMKIQTPSIFIKSTLNKWNVFINSEYFLSLQLWYQACFVVKYQISLFHVKDLDPLRYIVCSYTRTA